MVKDEFQQDIVAICRAFRSEDWQTTFQPLVDKLWEDIEHAKQIEFKTGLILGIPDGDDND